MSRRSSTVHCSAFEIRYTVIALAPDRGLVPCSQFLINTHKYNIESYNESGGDLYGEM